MSSFSESISAKITNLSSKETMDPMLIKMLGLGGSSSSTSITQKKQVLIAEDWSVAHSTSNGRALSSTTTTATPSSSVSSFFSRPTVRKVFDDDDEYRQAVQKHVTKLTSGSTYVCCVIMHNDVYDPRV
jgi:hypothetical protein